MKLGKNKNLYKLKNQIASNVSVQKVPLMSLLAFT